MKNKKQEQVKRTNKHASPGDEMKVVRVAELFAGVGGFRIGLETADASVFKTIFSSQWEPGTRRQYASEIYVTRFGPEGHSNEDISLVPTSAIPDHELLVGGFPCQDYSVAKSLSQSGGIAGKKGVLWWQIHRIISEKKSKRPKYLLLENVDRMLKSPASQRGRDFAIMLASLSDLGYAVEWRVINAADYGMPQRRRRVFFFAFHKSTPLFKQLRDSASKATWMLEQGVLASAFPVTSRQSPNMVPFELDGELHAITSSFNEGNQQKDPFKNCGLMMNRQFWTVDVDADYHGDRITLGDIILPENEVEKSFFIKPSEVPKWKYQKGGKTIERVSKAAGHKYVYSEGGMVFPDPLDRPGRTIITGEGGATPSRFKHVVQMESGKLRRLTPIELERMNMFPDNHTAGIPDVKRAFMMGNALVVGIVSQIASVFIEKVWDGNDSEHQV